ncbi:MAG: hypothetical protein QM490_06085 [Candidatus Gracilibacteria bacterium]
MNNIIKNGRSVTQFDLENSEGNEIKTYKLLKRKILSEDGIPIGKRKAIHEFLERVAMIKNEDPIKVLYSLYRTGLSLEVIGDKFGYEESNLRYLFNNVLNWKLRDGNDRTPSGIKRREKSQNVSGINEYSKGLYNDTLKKYNQTLNNILETTSIDNKQPDLEHYNKLNGKYRKIIYIISYKFKKTIEETIALIQNLKKSGFSANLIEREINKELETFFVENPDMFVNIKNDDIRYICKKYSYEKYIKKEFNTVEIGKIDENLKSDIQFRLQYSLRNLKGITSRSDLEEKQKDTPESSKKILTNRLDTLTLTLGELYINKKPIDPIRFLIHLYYERKYSMQKVSKYLKNIGINWPRSSLENQKKLFGWELNTKINNKIGW